MAGTAAMSLVAHMSQVPARLLLLPVIHAMQGLQVGGSMWPFRPQKRPAGKQAEMSIQIATWRRLMHARNVGMADPFPEDSRQHAVTRN
jgi:hypothetical protein